MLTNPAVSELSMSTEPGTGEEMEEPELKRRAVWQSWGTNGLIESKKLNFSSNATSQNTQPQNLYNQQNVKSRPTRTRPWSRKQRKSKTMFQPAAQDDEDYVPASSGQDNILK